MIQFPCQTNIKDREINDKGLKVLRLKVRVSNHNERF